MKLRVNKNIGIALGLFLLIIWTCIPLLSGQVLAVQGDGLGYVTGKIFMMNSLKMGEIPLWNPYSVIGTPFLADVQNTFFSPFNLLYFLFDIPLAFNLMRVVQIFIACFFMYLLMNELIKNRIVAVVTGLVFGFSTIMGGIRIEHHTFATTIAMFPAVLYFLEKYRSSHKEKWLAFSSIAMAIQFLSGFTQLCFYFDILAFVYLVHILWDANVSLKSGIYKIVKWVCTYVTLVGVQIIPLLQLMGQSGRDKVSWDFFSVHAYDFRILLMMLFPYAYVNNDGYRAVFGFYNSSELDIEIYIGIVCLIYIVYEIIFHYRERKTKILTNIALAALIFGMSPHIPLLGKLIYRLPILGSFRCSARSLSLFIFVFLVLFGMGISHIKEGDERKKILKISRCFIIILSCNIFIMSCVFSQNMLFTTESTQAYRLKFLISMCAALMMVLLNHVLIKLAECLGKRDFVVKVVTVVVGIVIVCDVSRFSRVPDETIGQVQDILPSHLSVDVEKTVGSDTENFFRSFLVMRDTSVLAQSYTRLGQAGRALNEEKLLYNSYITFLDDKLDFWGIKETFLYPRFINAIYNNNDLVCMMGIRHIIDSKGSQVRTFGTDGTVGSSVWGLDKIVLPASQEVTAVALEADWIEENSFYEIIVECDKDGVPSFFNVDLYGQNYDDPMQEAELIKETTENEYRAIISTDTLPEGVPVYFRILGNSETDLLIDRVTINKLKTSSVLQMCQSEDPAVNIYENVNARPLLYTPDRIYSVESYGETWMESGMQDVDKNNYIVNYAKNLDLTAGKVEINDINMRNNSIQAEVIADMDTFVNFSQLSYPGWEAYVDGEQVTCYTVNNLIMGAEVPQGTHSIEFRFSPNDVKLGLLITIIGILTTLMWIFDVKLWRKRK